MGQHQKLRFSIYVTPLPFGVNPCPADLNLFIVQINVSKTRRADHCLRFFVDRYKWQRNSAAGLVERGIHITPHILGSLALVDGPEPELTYKPGLTKCFV